MVEKEASSIDSIISCASQSNTTINRFSSHLENHIKLDIVFNQHSILCRHTLDWDAVDDYLYHYTSKNFARSILQDMKLKATRARIPHFGYGVFFTKHEPSLRTYDLLDNNYRGNTKYFGRLECAFAIKADSVINFIKIRDRLYPSRDIWKCSHDIDLSDCEFYLIFRD